MKRVLLIDPDRAAREKLGLDCLLRETGVLFAESLSDGVRALLDASVSMIVVDASVLPYSPREHVTLFERVAPGIPVVVAVEPKAPLETRVAYEVLGATVLTKPVEAEDLLDKAIVARP